MTLMTGHKIDFENSEILDQTNRWWNSAITEAIEIGT